MAPEYNNSNFLFLDGGMGTQLLAAGLQLGQRPELLCFSDPEIVANVHRRYIAAGSDVIYTNTFGANAHTLAGTGYTVEIENGSFIPGDAVELYRDKGHSNSKHIGSGTAARQNPVAVTGTGSIVAIAVENGQAVKKGDLLLETLEGGFDSLVMTGTEIRSENAGVVAKINAEQGSAIAKDSVVAVLYTRDSMRVSAEVPEDSLDQIAAGDSVHIELAADESKTYDGVVRMISGVATESATSGEVTYRALIDFTPDDAVRYGMSVVVETRDAQSAERDEEEEPEEDEEADQEEGSGQPDEETPETGKRMERGGPDGQGRPQREGQ